MHSAPFVMCLCSYTDTCVCVRVCACEMVRQNPCVLMNTFRKDLNKISITLKTKVDTTKTVNCLYVVIQAPFSKVYASDN